MADNQEILAELRSMRSEHIQNHNEVMTKLVTMEADNKNMDVRMEKQEKKVDTLDKNAKKRNLVIYGIPEKEGELYTDIFNIVMDLMNQRMGINLKPQELDDFFRIGKRGNTQKVRPILLKMVSYWKKREILSQTVKLKGTKIFIANDLTTEEAEEMKQLRIEKRELQSKGHQVTIKGKQLVIDGKIRSKTTRGIIPIHNDFDELTMEISSQGTPENTRNAKRQISPEVIQQIYSETNVEQNTKKKIKTSSSLIRSSSMNIPSNQKTLESLGISTNKTGEASNSYKPNVLYQQIVYPSLDPDKTHQDQDNVTK